MIIIQISDTNNKPLYIVSAMQKANRNGLLNVIQCNPAFQKPKVGTCSGGAVSYT
jgi:hypothetical protein